MNKDLIAMVQNTIAEKTTPTFCALPWIHMATRPNGDMRLCCSANASGAGSDHTVGLVKQENGDPINFNTTTPMEAWNSDYMKSVRTTMMEGAVPASCTKCFAEESQGVVSKRLWETGTWMERGLAVEDLLNDTGKDGTYKEELQYLDLRLGHTCNIKCVMCSPHDSSKWVKDWKVLEPQLEDPEVKRQMQWNKAAFNNKWHENEIFWDQLYKQIPNLKEVYFAGGEPLMIAEHKKFIEEIVRSGHNEHIRLRYNTNGILVDQDLIELWKHFDLVKVGVSIDAAGPRNNYIRYPTDWATVERNLHMLDSTPDNIRPSIATAIQIFNIKHLPDFIHWKNTQNFRKVNTEIIRGVKAGGGLVNMHLLYIPTFMSIQILPKEDKAEIRELFAKFKSYLYDFYTKDPVFWEQNPYGWRRWEAILNHMDAQDNSHLLPGFKEYVNKLDAIRGVNAKDVFPELAHLL
jgi:sulfatase maturation enzyme AslB (radical SAM superfamily)